MKYFYLIFLTLSVFVAGQNVWNYPNPEIAQYNSEDCQLREKGQIAIPKIHVLKSDGISSKRAFEAFDLVLGLATEDTLHIIEEDTRIDGDILLYNNARLEILSCDIEIDGNVIASDNSNIFMRDASINIESSRSYLHSIRVENSSVIIMENSNIDCAFDFMAQLLDSSQISLNGCNFESTSCDFRIEDFAAFSAVSCSLQSDIIISGGNGIIEMTETEGVTLWAGFPSAAEGEISADMMDGSFDFPDDSESGIDYEISMSDCHSELGIISNPNNIINIDDAHLTGIVLNSDTGDSIIIENLVNGRRIDGNLDISDRIILMDNSRSDFYIINSAGDAELQISGCRIGGLTSNNSSSIEMKSSTITGISGPVLANDRSNIDIEASNIYAPVHLAGESECFLRFVYHDYGEIIAANSAMAKFQNVHSFYAPEVRDSASVLFLDLTFDLDWWDLPIIGTMKMLAGDMSSASLDSFRIKSYYSHFIDDEPEFYEQTTWFRDSYEDEALPRVEIYTYSSEVVYETIVFDIRCSDFISDCSLIDYMVECYFYSNINEANQIPKMHEMSISPNPFNSKANITLPEGYYIENIYDIFCREIDFTEQAWIPDDEITSGIYIIKAKNPEGDILTGKAVYSK